MKSIFFFIILFVPGMTFSQDSLGVNSGALVTICSATTIDGTHLKGKLVSEDKEKIIILDITLGEVTVSKKKIRDFERISPDSYFEIELTNNSLTGKIIGADKNKWKIISQTVGEVEVNASDIKDIYEVKHPGDALSGELVNIDPGRYFIGSAPFALKRNRVLFQSTEILLNGFSYGLLSDFTISGGLLYVYIPYGNIKYATQIAHNVHISIGAAGIGFPIITSGSELPLLGAGYGQVAFGTSENHISGGVYYPYFGSVLGNHYDGFGDDLAYSVGGIKRIRYNVSIMAETYMFSYPTKKYHYNPYSVTYTSSYVNAGAIGVKIFLKKGLFGSNSAVLNVGMLWIAGGDVGIRNGSFIAFPIISYANISSRSNKK